MKSFGLVDFYKRSGYEKGRIVLREVEIIPGFRFWWQLNLYIKQKYSFFIVSNLLSQIKSYEDLQSDPLLLNSLSVSHCNTISSFQWYSAKRALVLMFWKISFFHNFIFQMHAYFSEMHPYFSENLHEPISGQCFLSMPHENVRNQRFSDVFRWYRKGTLAWNGLKKYFKVISSNMFICFFMFYICTWMLQLHWWF